MPVEFDWNWQYYPDLADTVGWYISTHDVLFKRIGIGDSYYVQKGIQVAKIVPGIGVNDLTIYTREGNNEWGDPFDRSLDMVVAILRDISAVSINAGMDGFTKQKPFYFLEQDFKNLRHRLIRCFLCGHAFKEYDVARWVRCKKQANRMICAECLGFEDLEEVIEAHYKDGKKRFWWMNL